MHCIGLALGVALASALVVGLLAIDFHGIYLGIAGWALLIAMVCVGFFLGTFFPRYCVVKGGEIVVYRDRVLIPRAFSGLPDDVPMHELQIEVDLEHRARKVAIKGVVHPAMHAVATRVTIGRERRPRILSARLFADAAQPFRVADDVRRARKGVPLRDHDQFDPQQMLEDAQAAFPELLQGNAPRPSDDEYDQKLDEELRALDAPKKSDQK